MRALCQSKYIDGQQHHLYEIDDDEDWSLFPWRIHEKDKMYWIPITTDRGIE